MTESFTAQILPERAIIRMAGDQVLGFLQGLITADVQALAEGTWAHGALLSPQGKIQHELFVFNRGDAVFIDCVRSQREALLRKLIMYRLRAKIEIAADDSLAVMVAPQGQGLPPDPRLADLGGRAIVAVGSAIGDGEGYQAHRLALGIPDGALDLRENEHFPHEANFDLLHGVSFSKGCYVGQEVVSRMQHRGTARSRMLPLVCDGDAPPHGTAITSGDRSIGTVLSSQGDQAMALIRLDRLAEAQAPLLSNAVRLHVRKPAWMAIDVPIPEVVL